MASVGFGGGTRRGSGGRPPQALRINVPRSTVEERTEKEYFICRQAPGASGDAANCRGRRRSPRVFSSCAERLRLAVTARRGPVVIGNTTPVLVTIFYGTTCGDDGGPRL